MPAISSVRFSKIILASTLLINQIAVMINRVPIFYHEITKEAKNTKKI